MELVYIIHVIFLEHVLTSHQTKIKKKKKMFGKPSNAPAKPTWGPGNDWSNISQSKPRYTYHLHESKTNSSSSKVNSSLLFSFNSKDYDQNHKILVTSVAALGGSENGFIRIITNNETKRTRVVMRNLQLDKVLLNHFTNPGIELTIEGNVIEYETVDYATSNPKELKVKLVFPDDQKENISKFSDAFKKGQEENEKLIDEKSSETTKEENQQKEETKQEEQTNEENDQSKEQKENNKEITEKPAIKIGPKLGGNQQTTSSGFGSTHTGFVFGKKPEGNQQSTTTTGFSSRPAGFGSKPTGFIFGKKPEGNQQSTKTGFGSSRSGATGPSYGFGNRSTTTSRFTPSPWRDD